MNRADLMELIDRYAETCFECGSWNDDDDEAFETVYERNQKARAAVIASVLETKES